MRFDKDESGLITMVIEGQIDAQIMRAALEQFLEMAEGLENGRLLALARDVHWPTGGALGVELVFLPRLFSALAKLDRIAVVSEEDWIRRVAEIEGHLLPHADVETFEDEAAARDWLA
ncbi:MAG: STAS/SEC14 domain-containing protein [Rubricella sp.]